MSLMCARVICLHCVHLYCDVSQDFMLPGLPVCRKVDMLALSGLVGDEDGTGHHIAAD
jgi:hypothetical protein